MKISPVQHRRRATADREPNIKPMPSQRRENISNEQTKPIIRSRQCLSDTSDRRNSSFFAMPFSYISNSRRRRPAALSQRHESRKLLAYAAASALLCLPSTVGYYYSNNNEVTDSSTCCGEAPYSWIERIRSTCAVSKNNINHEKTKAQQHHAHIGDRVRDESSSFSFFRSVDSDGDGMLEPPEVAKFLRESIGGTAFDTQKEVDTGVNNVMEKLDRNHDEGLDKSDVFSYWMQLESLLNADEVAEWVVHAVQLPEYLGNIFKDNSVTGYDFPELVENEGEAIRTELHIERSSFRKKLVRHIHARMLGIGSVPNTPTAIEHTLESCSTVTFSWEKSIAEGFPVHSYRIQRRAVPLHDAAKKVNVSSDPPPALAPGTNDLVASDVLTANGKDPLSVTVASSSCEWVTVYVGGENEFVDSGLELGHNYVYRFQAWNSVGRSAWATADISRILKKHRCSLKPSQSKSAADILGGSKGGEYYDYSVRTFNPSSIFSGIYFFMTFIMTAIRGLVGLTGLAAAIMKFKRGSTTSTRLAKTETVFPWFFKGMNAFSRRVLGVDVVPASLLGDKKSMRDEASIHDKTVKAVGLNGYKESLSDDESDKHSTGRRITFAKSGSLDDSTVGDRRAGLRKQRSASCGDLGRVGEQTVTTETPPMKKPLNLIQRLRQKSADVSESEENEKSIPPTVNGLRCESPVCGFIDTAVPNTREISTLSEESDSIRQQDFEEDDYYCCNTCRKRYKIGKRWRHHCARCAATFCHKHGRTTHSNFTSCKVPGTCVCNVCLQSDKYSSRSKKRSFR